MRHWLLTSMTTCVRRAFAILVIAALGSVPLAPQAGQFCTHARVVMTHSCCPATNDPGAPRLLCCTPMGRAGTIEASRASDEGVRLALAVAPPQGLQTPAWLPLPLAAWPSAALRLVAQGPPAPLRI